MKRNGELIFIVLAALLGLALLVRGAQVYGYAGQKAPSKGSPASPENESAPLQAAQPAPAAPIAEAVLRAQLETTQRYDQQLLATVYWAWIGLPPSAHCRRRELVHEGEAVRTRAGFAEAVCQS